MCRTSAPGNRRVDRREAGQKQAPAAAGRPTIASIAKRKRNERRRTHFIALSLSAVAVGTLIPIKPIHPDRLQTSSAAHHWSLHRDINAETWKTGNGPWRGTSRC